MFPQVIAQTLGIGDNKIPHRNGDSSNELPGLCLGRLPLGDGRRPFPRQGDGYDSGKGQADRRANMLETGETDIVYRNGNFEVVGTDRRVALFDVAAHASEMKKRGEIAEDLDTKTTTDTPLAYPNGVPTAEVEIDPDTGHAGASCSTAQWTIADARSTK